MLMCSPVLTPLLNVGSSSPLSAQLLAQTSAPVKKRLPTRVDSLRRALTEIFSDSSASHALWGVQIQSLKTGQLIYERNSEQNFTPASNQKVLTLASAFYYLDTTFQYTTTAAMQGSLAARGDSATLTGNLILKSDGDPSLSGVWQAGGATAFFDSIADSLKLRRVTLITGDLIGDDADFAASEESMRLYSGGDGDVAKSWEWDDLAYGSAAPLSSLSFNENRIEVLAFPNDTLGKKPYIQLGYPTALFAVENLATTVAPRSDRTLKITRLTGTNRIIVSGELPQKRDYRETISVEKPALFYLSVLRETLARRGITVQGAVRRKIQTENFAYNAMPVVAQHRSPPLISLMRYCGRESNNFTAEMLLRTVGLKSRGEGSSAAGLEQVKKYLTSLGIPAENLRLVDGSGLSRQNCVSPAALVRVLKSFYKAKSFESFRSTLAIAGVDGTLKRRLVGTKAEGNLKAKTGFITGVRTLTGYIESADRELFAFSMMTMNYTIATKEIEEIQDRAIEALANWSRTPTGVE